MSLNKSSAICFVTPPFLAFCYSRIYCSKWFHGCWLWLAVATVHEVKLGYTSTNQCCSYDLCNHIETNVAASLVITGKLCWEKSELYWHSLLLDLYYWVLWGILNVLAWRSIPLFAAHILCFNFSQRIWWKPQHRRWVQQRPGGVVSEAPV